MKNIFPFLLVIAALSCNNPADKTQALQDRVDSLQKKLDQSYKPGLGEFMSTIQVHHAKLWFAGQNQNWALANFETGEIKEALDGILQYCTDRPELQKLPMINPAMDSIGLAISAKNQQQFKSSFVLLTATCNNCHRASNHSYNVIKIPETPPFSNQAFTAHLPD